MENSNNSSPNYILLLKSMDNPKLCYMVAKKLSSMFTDATFGEWKAKLDAGETVVLMRSKTKSGLQPIKKEFDEMDAPVEIVQQKTIGGNPIF